LLLVLWVDLVFQSVFHGMTDCLLFDCIWAAVKGAELGLAGAGVLVVAPDCL
jgi:hypothetical protein